MKVFVDDSVKCVYYNNMTMIPLKKKLFILFFSFVSLVIAQAQKIADISDSFLSDYVSRTWTAYDGLPGNTITDIMQDSSGYIYFGTYTGLVRFDGVEFVTFNRSYDPKYDFVAARSVFQDSDGTIWIGSNDDGLIGLGKDGNVEKYTVETGLSNNSVRSICEDNAKTIWVGTASGIVCLKRTDGRGKREIVRPKGLEQYGEENILVCQLFCDSSGRIWAATSKANGLYVYSSLSESFTRFEGIKKIKDPAVDVVMQEKSGAFWFGVAPHYAIRIDGENEVMYDLAHNEQGGSSVSHIYQDSNSNIWFSTESGVVILHNGKFSYYGTEDGLTDAYVLKVLEDREGNIWFATNRGGVEKLSLGKFNTRRAPTAINSIAEDKFRNVVWLAGDNGLYCYKNNKFLENDVTDFCKNIRIRDVEVQEDGTLNISTYEKYGLVRVSPDGTKKLYGTKEGLSGIKVRVTLSSSDGSLYVGTTTGLNIIDGKTGEITKITKDDGIANDFIMCISEDSAGAIWVGTDGGGIFSLVDKKVDKIYNTEKGLAGNVVFKINEMKQGELWITTGNGISRIKEGKVFNFNSSNGLGTDAVFQIILDHTQTAWMTGNSGIFSAKFSDMESLADGKIKQITTKFFGKSDGLVSGGVTSTSRSMKDSLGRLWFTMIDGFALYDPVKAASNKVKPLVEIQEVQIDGKRFDTSATWFIIPPSAKRLSFKFTGLTFISSEQTRFSYKLVGFDDDYSEWDLPRTVSYTNLKYGTYKFSVYSENGDGIKSDLSRVITIVKEPYFWELLWFKITLPLVILGIAAFIVFLRFKAMKRYQIVLENKVEERTRDLQNEMKKSRSLLLSILPEDVANDLTEHPNDIHARKFPNVTVLFTDIVGFTKMSDRLSAEEVVSMLNRLITKFDLRAKQEGIEKIKTIGDAYMAASGLTEDKENDGAIRMLRYAKGIIEDVNEFNRDSKNQVQIRLGINTGNLVAGVIGKTKFIYDIWGDTVNVASRMESSGKPMLIHVTEETYKMTKNYVEYGEPVEIEVKGKGMMKTYFSV